MRSLLQSLLRHLALRHNVAVPLWRRLCRPAGEEVADYLRRWGGFAALGERTCILLDTVVTDPEYVSIGSNVILSTCTLVSHDASAAVLSRAYEVPLDAVGPIVIEDDVFVGYGAIVLPGVRIGRRSVVAAGAVVTRDVPPGSVVGGVPARVLGSTDDLVQKLRASTVELPWADLIESRGGTPRSKPSFAGAGWRTSGAESGRPEDGPQRAWRTPRGAVGGCPVRSAGVPTPGGIPRPPRRIEPMGHRRGRIRVLWGCIPTHTRASHDP